MFISSIIQTVISLVFIYLLLALLTSEIQEAIASIFEMRAKRLKESIRQFFGENELQAENDASKQIKDSKIISITELLYKSSYFRLHNQKYYQGIIQSLWTGLNNLFNLDKNVFRRIRSSHGPSYIERHYFTKALLEVLNGDIFETSLNDSDLINDVNEKLKTVNENLKKKKVYSPGLKRLILLSESLLVEHPSADLVDFLETLEKLFDAAQLRSSGVYKRNAKGLSFILAFLVAVLANADAFNLVHILAEDTNQYREKLSQAIENSEDLFTCDDREKPEDKKACQDILDERIFTSVAQVVEDTEVLPLGWDSPFERDIAQERKTLVTFFEDQCKEATSEQPSTPENPDTPANPSIPANPSTPGQTDAQTESESSITPIVCAFNFSDKLLTSDLELSKIPDSIKTPLSTMGEQCRSDETADACKKAYQQLIKSKNELMSDYIASSSKEAREEQMLAQKINEQVNSQGGWFKVILGWFISAIAIEMGAPFWFELLGRIINVRNAGKVPEAEGEQ